MHGHPKLAEAANRAFAELKSNPQLKKELDWIISQKKEEWRAREASRKLVG
jgi:hypothetical protein